jgi:hypothetical protein
MINSVSCSFFSLKKKYFPKLPKQNHDQPSQQLDQQTHQDQTSSQEPSHVTIARLSQVSEHASTQSGHSTPSTHAATATISLTHVIRVNDFKQDDGIADAATETSTSTAKDEPSSKRLKMCHDVDETPILHIPAVDAGNIQSINDNVTAMICDNDAAEIAIPPATVVAAATSITNTAADTGSILIIQGGNASLDTDVADVLSDVSADSIVNQTIANADASTASEMINPRVETTAMESTTTSIASTTLVCSREGKQPQPEDLPVSPRFNWDDEDYNEFERVVYHDEPTEPTVSDKRGLDGTEKESHVMAGRVPSSTPPSQQRERKPELQISTGDEFVVNKLEAPLAVMGSDNENDDDDDDDDDAELFMVIRLSLIIVHN